MVLSPFIVLRFGVGDTGLTGRTAIETSRPARPPYLERLRTLAELGIGLHAKFCLVEAFHFLLFRNPDTDG